MRVPSHKGPFNSIQNSLTVRYGLKEFQQWQCSNVFDLNNLFMNACILSTHCTCRKQLILQKMCMLL